MYYIQNADGTRYGPASGETIAQWDREGRIADTARFFDAATEQQVDRERVLSPMPPSGYNAPQSPPGYGGAGQAQGYQPPSGYNQPSGYAPQPYLTGATGYGQGNPNHQPLMASLACLLCVLVGYIYNKQALKGVVITVGTVLLGLLIGDSAGKFLGFALLVFSMLDCYKIAQRIKAGETVGDWQFF